MEQLSKVKKTTLTVARIERLTRDQAINVLRRCSTYAVVQKAVENEWFRPQPPEHKGATT